MKLTDWNAFDSRCTGLVKENPNQASWTVKLKPNSKLLVLRLTTKAGSVTFQSRSSLFLNRFYQLQQQLSLGLAGVRPPKPVAPSSSSAVPTEGAATAAAEGGAVSGGQAGEEEGAKGGEPKAKKKKPKKKK